MLAGGPLKFAGARENSCVRSISDSSLRQRTWRDPLLCHSPTPLCSAVQKTIKVKSKTNLYENILNKNIGKDFWQTNIQIKSFVESRNFKKQILRKTF
jgi:hypothetical protein